MSPWPVIVEKGFLGFVFSLCIFSAGIPVTLGLSFASLSPLVNRFGFFECCDWFIFLLCGREALPLLVFPPLLNAIYYFLC